MHKLDLSFSIVRLAIALGAGKEPSGFSPAERELVSASSEAEEPSTAAVDAAKAAIISGGDPLGDMFYELRDAAERRGSGTVYTPAQIIEPMVQWTLAQSPERVVDAGCGSGRYTAALLRAQPSLTIIAIDLDPLATLMTRAVIAVLGSPTSKVVQGDFTRVHLPKTTGRTSFIGNPPYLRHHQIPSGTKEWAQKAAALLGHKISGLAGLHAYFFLATAMLGEKGDTGCYVTSAEWLDVNYGAIIRTLLTETLGGEQIHVIEPEAEPFEGTQTTAAVTLFRVGEPVESMAFRSVHSLAELGSFGVVGSPVIRARLLEASRWSVFIRTRTQVPAGHIELGELMRVHRGSVTGANKVWVARGPVDLPEAVLYSSVTKARELFAAGPALETTEGLRDVIDIPASLDEFDAEDLKRVERYLRAAKSLSAHEGYVARARRSWWTVGLRAPAPILATYMARRPPAFVLNRVKARHINIAHGLYPRQEMSENVLRRLAYELSTSVVLGQGRTYSGGLTKFEPGEMSRLPIPNLDTLSAYDSASAEVGQRPPD